MLVTLSRPFDHCRDRVFAGPPRLGPNEALRLAVLGVAAHGPVDLDELIATVGWVGGAAWRPCADVVLASVETLLLQGLLADSEMATPGVAPVLTVTPAGSDCLATLLRAPPPTGWGQLRNLFMTLQAVFLDLLPVPDRDVQLDRMIRDVEDERKSCEMRYRDHARPPPFVARLAAREHGRLDSDTAWLRSLRAE